MTAEEKDPSGASFGRRKFLAAGAGAAALGFPVPFLSSLPAGVTPLAFASDTSDPNVAAFAALKPGLSMINDRPLNLETPPHLLDDDITPGERMFVRNNGTVPDVTPEALASWTLTIDGEVENPLTLSLEALKHEFKNVTLRLLIECAGNGRRFMKPETQGGQWTFGAVSCAEWTGVRLADVLARARPRPSAIYTAHKGADAHLSGDPSKDAISRGVPIAKAMEPHTLIAFSMNGADIPLLNGHPLRLIAPGWPGSCSQKWLTRITLRDVVHDGHGMTGYSYRLPAYPIAPGADIPEADMRIIESMPVKSLITAPQTGARVKAGTAFEVRGHAWAGDDEAAAVEISDDFGATWRAAMLAPIANRYAWRRWRLDMRLPARGYYEIWARARDDKGRMQPATPPGWNPRGYNNNMQHRIAVFAL